MNPVRRALLAALDSPRESVRRFCLAEARASAGRRGRRRTPAWVREQMAAYKAPRAVRFAERLPRSATGKIDWRALQQQERG